MVWMLVYHLVKKLALSMVMHLELMSDLNLGYHLVGVRWYFMCVVCTVVYVMFIDYVDCCYNMSMVADIIYVKVFRIQKSNR